MVDLKSTSDTFDEPRYKGYNLEVKSLNEYQLKRVYPCKDVIMLSVFHSTRILCSWLASSELSMILIKCEFKESSRRNCGYQRRGLICTESCKTWIHGRLELDNVAKFCF